MATRRRHWPGDDSGMKFACESCHAQYMISDEKVGAKGVKVRCKKCNHVNVVRRQAPATDPDVVAAAEPTPQRPAGSLDDELGAAFDHVVSGAPPAAVSAPVPADDPFAASGPSFVETRPAEKAESPAVEWYVAVGDQQVGPLPFDSVRAKWDAGEIGTDTLCWRTGMADWTALSQIPELAAALAPRAAAPAASGDAGWLKAAMSPQDAAPAWKPSAASALASLVEKELEAANRPVVAPEATLERDLPPGAESTGIRTLLRELPKGAQAPAPEVSRLLPIGGDVTAVNAAAAPAAAPAREAAKPAAAPAPAAPAKSGGGTGKWIAAAAALVVVAGGAFFARGLIAPPAAQAVVAPAPAPIAAAAPVPVPAPAAAPEPAPAAPAPEPVAAAPVEAAPAPAAEAQPAVAAAAEEPKAAPVKAEPEPTPVRTKRQAATARHAVAERPAPPPPPAPKAAPRPAGSGDLLAAAGSTDAIDDLFESEFRQQPKKAPPKSGGTYIPPAPGGGGKPQQLSQGDIAGVVVGHKAELKSCATNYKQKHGGSGTVVMRWTILPTGRTSGVKAVKGTEHKELAGCIGNLVNGWRFPAYSGPQMAPIDFPFQF